MSSEVKIREENYMDNNGKKESFQSRIREIEDENQELRAQNLRQNRTIIDMRNEILLLRLQITEMAETSALLTDRVRNLTQNITQNSMRSESDGNGLITAPPLMAPPPVPPPLPPARIRISPRQVGAGEALTTPLGVSLSSPPRHRVKRDSRQGFYRANRSPCRRLDVPEPGPSTPSQFFPAERPNYFVGLRIIPQFQTSFICSQNQAPAYSDSASDSSGSDENPQIFKKLKMKVFDGESSVKKSGSFSRDFELLKNVRNFHHHRVRQAILQNYNLALPNTNSKFFFPLSLERKNRDSMTQPSTSGNDSRLFNLHGTSSNQREFHNLGTSAGLRSSQKISDCPQYTFPTIHEGLHSNNPPKPVTGETVRLRKLKKNMLYSASNYSTTGESNLFMTQKKEIETDDDMQFFMASKIGTSLGACGVETEFRSSSTDEAVRAKISPTTLRGELSSDFEQDGFQADESSNCMTSTENSLEKISISESNMEKKDGGA